jgi:hypothetical protein
MNVRVHFKDFTHKDFKDVKEIRQRHCSDVVEIVGPETGDEEVEPCESLDWYSIMNIEIRN